MSIIVEALKKIQTQRSGGLIPDNIIGDTKTGIPRAGAADNAHPPKTRTRLKAFPVVAAACIFSIAVSVFFLRNRPSMTATESGGKDAEIKNTAVYGSAAGEFSKSPSNTAAAPATKADTVSHYKTVPAARMPGAQNTFKQALEKSIRTPFVNGIMYSVSYPQVILDGQLAVEGDTVNGFTIVKILPNSVKGTIGGREVEIKL